LKNPVFEPTRQLDFELEMAFITRGGKPLGQSIGVNEAEDYIVGLCLFNDWSARDIQAWEYVPLGPFLGKNFASTMSPWIILLDALQPFICEAPVQDVEVLPYLQEKKRNSYDINLQVAIQAEKSEEQLICESNYKYLYWTMSQQLAHHSVNGCNIQCGDVLASGTISGKAENSYGSMLELCWKGTKPIVLKDGTSRTFINDNDTIIMRAFCYKSGIRVGFGECVGKILPAV
jgi:fumarylacetoacetase